MLSGSTLRRLAALILLASSSWVSAQFYDLDRGREPIVSLDGQWRFHTGDSPLAAGSRAPLWAGADFDDSGWGMLNSNKSWSEQGYPAMSGYAWYRFKVAIPANEKPSSLLLAPIETSYVVYVDGKVAGVCGDPSPSMIPSSDFSFHLFPSTSEATSTPRIIQVALRVWHSPMWANYVGAVQTKVAILPAIGHSSRARGYAVNWPATRDSSMPTPTASRARWLALPSSACFCFTRRRMSFYGFPSSCSSRIGERASDDRI